MTAEGLADIVLASGSKARRGMLEAAGVRFRVVTPEVDEDAIRAVLARQGQAEGPTSVARALARAKSEDVSGRTHGALVIGADQVLALDETIFTKPADIETARGHLKRLAGRRHALHSAVSLAVDGRESWAHVETAWLDMRLFSDEFLDAYLAQAGTRVLGSVGAYELEGLGVQLFERIEGDYFTILGLPLLALLDELRSRSALLQ